MDTQKHSIIPEPPQTAAAGRSGCTFLVLMPAYNEAERVGEAVRGARRHAPEVVVIDDGSTDDTAAEAERAGAVVLRHDRNRGKGAALQTGFRYAQEKGVECVIAMDADGQHDPEEIPLFLETYRRTGLPVLIGDRMTNVRGMPRVRRWTNRYMSRLLSRRIGQVIPDTQNGYRLYRCDSLPARPLGSARFAADSEILLEMAARGVRFGAVPTRVIYRDERSKINPIRDTVRFYRMLKQWRAL
ncbi:MAG: glycosyltransferase family 2 protein [Lentisphaerae bacterium]|nr:glycosyltransferase family 2 protein [Lentisphaerota bacterium]